MTDRDLLAACDALLAEPVGALELPHPAAPALILQLFYDGGGILCATWRLGAWSRLVEAGEA